MVTIDVYQSEIDDVIPLEFIGKVQYIGPSFGVDSLTDGTIYDVVYDSNGDMKIIDDSGEDYLYDFINPKPLDGSSEGGVFNIVEDPNDILLNVIRD